MRPFRTLSPLLLLLPSVVACSSSGGKPDAFFVIADAKPDAPPLPPGCDFAELSDTTNDTFGTGTPEDTGLTFAAATGTTVCGTVNSNHYQPPTMAGEIGLVDSDSFKFTLAADASLYVTMSGAGLETLKGSFRIYTTDAMPANVLFGEMHAGHTANHVSLKAGTYELNAVVLADTAATADVKYKIKIVTEMVDARCAYLATGGYAEASDGAANTSNDMIIWKFADMTTPMGAVLLTASTADVPENTGIVAAAGTTYRVTGNSANNAIPNATTDDYKDHDTFKFTTGPTTNEVSIRMKFPTTTADLDVAIASVPVAGDTVPNLLDVSNRLAAGPSEELLTTAVEPNTAYWLWIAGYKDHPPGMAPSTAATYEATICPKTATP